MRIKISGFLQKNQWVIGFNVLGLYLFAKMAEDVIEQEFILVIDRWISIHANKVQTPILDQIMIALTNLNGGFGVVVFSMMFMLCMLYLKWYRDILFYLLCVGGSSVIFMTIKVIVSRLRPSSELIEVSGYSFPSGHVTMATALSAALYFILIQRVHGQTLKVLLLFVCLIWPLIIAASRVYLDVHWLSDVVAGLGLGLFWVTFIVLLKRL